MAKPRPVRGVGVAQPGGLLPASRLVGPVGCPWLTLASLRAIFRRRRPDLAPPAGWGLAFAAVRRLTNPRAFSPARSVFRETNRLRSFVWAAVPFLLAAQSSRSGRERRLRTTGTLAPAWGQTGSLVAPRPAAGQRVATNDR